MALLASEILAVTGTSPSQHYRGLTDQFGAPVYARVDAPATREQKARLKDLSPEQVTATELAGEPITATLTRAPGNDAPIGGLKCVPTTDGSRPGRRGPRTCTRSTRNRSSATNTLARIQAEARTWSPQR